MTAAARPVVALVLVLIAIGVAAMPAAASTQTTAADEGAHLSAVEADLGSVAADLRGARARLLATADTLTRREERTARAAMALGWASAHTAAPGPAADTLRRAHIAHLRDAYEAAARSLRLAQRDASAGGSLPAVARLERRRDSLRAERRRTQAVLDALAQAPPPAGGVGISRGDWAAGFLQQIGAPVCSNNLVSLVAWQTAESTTARWNPLATTQPAAGAADYNAVGVKSYASRDDGMAATEQTLRWGYDTQGYGWILYRLWTCADPAVTATAINRSNWCRGCAGGAYVTGLLPAVETAYAEYAAL